MVISKAGFPPPDSELFKQLFQTLKTEIKATRSGNTWTYEVKNLTNTVDKKAYIFGFQLEFSRAVPVNQFDESGRRAGVFITSTPYGWEGRHTDGSSVFWLPKEGWGAEIGPGQSLTFQIIAEKEGVTWKSTKVTCLAFGFPLGISGNNVQPGDSLFYVDWMEGPGYDDAPASIR